MTTKRGAQSRTAPQKMEKTTKSDLDTDSGIDRDNKRKNTSSSNTDDTTLLAWMTNDNSNIHRKNIIQ